jgi:hypothetical protein
MGIGQGRERFAFRKTRISFRAQGLEHDSLLDVRANRWGLVGGFKNSVKADKTSPSQRIKLSLKNSLTVFLVTCLICGLIIWLMFVPICGLTFGLIDGLRPSYAM